MFCKKDLTIYLPTQNISSGCLLSFLSFYFSYLFTKRTGKAESHCTRNIVGVNIISRQQAKC